MVITTTGYGDPTKATLVRRITRCNQVRTSRNERYTGCQLPGTTQRLPNTEPQMAPSRLRRCF